MMKQSFLSPWIRLQRSILFVLAILFLFINAAQAQPEFSPSDIRLMRERKFNPQTFRLHSESEMIPPVQLYNQSNSFLADGDIEMV